MTDQDGRRTRLMAMSLALASMAPALLAFNLPPSPTLLGQCLALGVWGSAVATVGASAKPGNSSPGTDAWPLHLCVACCVAAGVLSMQRSAWPVSLALSTFGVLLAFAVVVELASACHRIDRELGWVSWFLCGLVVAGVINAVIGIVQVGWPQVPDGNWIARSGLPGRAVGNLRQPNHLSSLLLWALIAVVALLEVQHLRPRWSLLASGLLLCALVLTGSRTGVLGVLLLAGWGALDRRLSRSTRLALIASPFAFGLMWISISGWAHATGHAFSGEGRLSLGDSGDISSSRFAIWSNTLSMIAREPFWGVGFGEFNLAWTLTAFPGRPTAFFDHTHNLPLQLLVELGIPLGSVVLMLLSLALYQAWRRAWTGDGGPGILRRASFLIVLMIGLHSMLEYPLWYAYFLLPTGFAWGVALLRPPAAQPQFAPAPPAGGPHQIECLLLTVGAAMMLGAVAAVLDYNRVAVIYSPPDDAAPLEERIARGQGSPLFGHHADYAAATAFGEPQAPLSSAQKLAFHRAPHQLLDVRLMIAWAQALAAQGELDKARWLAARIREFHNPGSEEFFAPCRNTPPPKQAFQCQPPLRAFDWRDFAHD